MKKKLMALLLGTVMTLTMITPAFAASEPISLAGVDGTVSLTKSTSGATGKTTYGAGRQVTATRTVSVTIKCTYGGKDYTFTDSATAVTNSANYNSSTASITVRPTSTNYTVNRATSTHKVSISSGSITRNLTA